MKFSVIISAYNSEDTISETLDSLLQQTHPEWEAVVVDDESTDNTKKIIQQYEAKDSRIVLISQNRKGEAGARNTGLERSSNEWILFLDSDDWILPNCLERCAEKLTFDPSLEAVHYGWSRVTPDRRSSFEKFGPASNEIFETAAVHCPWAVHACVINRSILNNSGLFDTSFLTCSDWDFWLRVARTGVRFGSIQEVLAKYRMRPGSAGTRSAQLLSDGFRVIESAHSADPRVKDSDPKFANGMPSDHLREVKLMWAVWAGALEIGIGKDARYLLTETKGIVPSLHSWNVAQRIFEAALLPTCRTPEEWPDLWLFAGTRIGPFLDALEDRSRKGFARQTLTILERFIFHAAKLTHLGTPDRNTDFSRHSKTPDGSADFSRHLGTPALAGSSTILASSMNLTVEVIKHFEDFVPPRNIERLYCTLTVEGEPIGLLELPVCDGRVRSFVVCDAICADHSWKILGKFFEKTIYPTLRYENGSVFRGDLCLSNEISESSLHDQIGWTIFLQELWGKPDWSREAFEDSSTDEGQISCLQLQSSRVAIELSNDLQDLAFPLETDRGTIVVQLAGVPIGAVAVRCYARPVRAQEIRHAIILNCGFELCRIAVREALLGVPFSGDLSLRERFRKAASRQRFILNSNFTKLDSSKLRRVRRKFSKNAVILGRRTTGPIGSSVSRRYAFPSATEHWLVTSSRIAGDEIFESAPLPGVPKLVYAPELISDSLQANDLQVVPLDPSQPATWDLPILMYHRVAQTNSRYCVTPQAFAEQMHCLQSNGFRTVTFAEWQECTRASAPLPGKAVLLTFDDGYEDFYSQAWPLLRKLGFSATVFLVAKEIGGTNRWDQYSSEDEKLRLMKWMQILELRDAGIDFGSHSATHSFMTALPFSEIVREAAQSKAILESKLQKRVTAFAYPHGAEDPVVQHFIGGCGYIFGVTTRMGKATRIDPLLALPRIEIAGGDTLADFKTKLSLT